MSSSERPVRLIDDMRGVRYGEVLAMYLRDGGGLHAEVYGTQMLNDCPQELWETLDAATIAKEMEAAMVKLNGPRHWVLDGLGTKVAVGTARGHRAAGLGHDGAAVGIGSADEEIKLVERFVGSDCERASLHIEDAVGIRGAANPELSGSGRADLHRAAGLHGQGGLKRCRRVSDTKVAEGRSGSRARVVVAGQGAGSGYGVAYILSGVVADARPGPVSGGVVVGSTRQVGGRHVHVADVAGECSTGEIDRAGSREVQLGIEAGGSAAAEGWMEQGSPQHHPCQ